MRFTYGLLGALASSAMGQRFTNSSTSAVTTTSEAPTATSSGAIGPPEPVDISSAILGPFAEFINLPGGGIAIQLSAPANGVASFSISGNLPENISLDDLINILFSLLVFEPDNRKRALTDCSLDVTLNGASVFSEQAKSTGNEFFQRATTATGSTGNQQDGDQANVEFVQTCGENPVKFQVTDIKVAPNTGSDNGPGDGGSGAVTTGTDGEPITTGTELPTDSEGNPIVTATETFPTDSEGNPIITGTQTFPTDSEGNPIITGTDIPTDSEGNPIITGTQTFPTDSAGNPIITGTDVSDTVSEPTASETSVAGFPPTVGEFSLFGCVGSTAGFPSFELAQSSGSMDLDLCASLCGDSAYFGVYDTDCYCGDVVDSDDTSRVDLDSCDIECPGDDSEFCGGDAPISRRSRIHARQAIPNTILLTVYVQLGGGADSTVTNVIDATVTDQSTITTTFVTTIAGATTTEVQTVTAIYECHNGQCYPNTGEYCYDGKCYSNGGNGGRVIVIFAPYPGEDCDGQTVYIPETCNCKGGSQYVPKYCSGGSCHGLTVYKPKQTSHWSEHDVCYTATDCDACEHGDVIYKPWEDSWGTPSRPVYGDHGVPSCSKPGCPVYQEESDYKSHKEESYSSHKESDYNSHSEEEESYSNHKESDYTGHGGESASGNHKESDYNGHGDESASGNHHESDYGNDSGSDSTSGNHKESDYGSDSGSKGVSGNPGADSGSESASGDHQESDYGSDSGSKGASGDSGADSGSEGASGDHEETDSGSKGAEGSSSDSGSKGAEANPEGSSSDSGSKGSSGHPGSDVPVTVSSAGKQAVSAVALLAAVVAALF